jgi:hypothetical protein
MLLHVHHRLQVSLKHHQWRRMAGRKGKMVLRLVARGLHFQGYPKLRILEPM